MEEFLTQILIALGPDLIYLGLIVGLWLGVTAVYMPGTGIIEAIAMVLILGIFILLTRMATNWWAVLLLVVGVAGFLIVPFLSKKWAQYAEVGLVLQAAGGVFLFDNLRVSWLVIVLTIGLAFLYHRFLLMPILIAHRDHKGLPGEDAQLVGAHGRVVKPIDPVGTVNVHSELWTARSDKPLQSGDEIIVVDRNGLELFVEKIKQKRTSEED